MFGCQLLSFARQLLRFEGVHAMSDDSFPQSEFILYQTEDGRTRIQCRFENETLWLTQIQIAELFQTTVPNINLHLKAIYAEGELTAEATIKSHLIVRFEGARQVSRPVLHYNLAAILAVGFRVRSHRGTQFRQWATARLSEYLVKGFTMDDERLKNPPGKEQKDYFDELLERIREWVAEIITLFAGMAAFCSTMRRDSTTTSRGMPITSHTTIAAFVFPSSSTVAFANSSSSTPSLPRAPRRSSQVR